MPLNIRLTEDFIRAIKRCFMAEEDKIYKNILGKYGILGGRPVAFKSPKAMRLKMLEFLDNCEKRHQSVVLKTGNIGIINVPAPITIEDFCAFAGITKTTFYDYGKKTQFKNLVDGFKQIVEAYWVRQCAEGNKGNKADFVLKNAFSDDWKDKSDITGSIVLKQALIGYDDDGVATNSSEDGEIVRTVAAPEDKI